MTDDSRGKVFPSDIAVGFGTDVYGIFQAGGDGAVVLGRDKKYPVGGFDDLAEQRVFRRGRFVADLGVIVVEIVKREIRISTMRAL